MIERTGHSAKRAATERAAVRRRVKHFYSRFNRADWDDCYALIDPQLAQGGRARLDTYSELMQAFKDAYGSVKLWLTRISLHLDASPNQGDKRPFAYVYVIWQDDAYRFHMFRERWIKEGGRWFTRVVGLVPNRQGAEKMSGVVLHSQVAENRRTKA